MNNINMEELEQAIVASNEVMARVFYMETQAANLQAISPTLYKEQEMFLAESLCDLYAQYDESIIDVASVFHDPLMDSIIDEVEVMTMLANNNMVEDMEEATELYHDLMRELSEATAYAVMDVYQDQEL